MSDHDRIRDARRVTRDASERAESCRFTLHASRFTQSGVSLVELVVAIIIIAIAVSAVMGVLSMVTKGSADAMIRNQAVAIASSYLEEIRLKNFTTGAGTGSRAAFDDINDYDGLVDVGARDQFGNAIAGLDQYTVRVTVGAGTIGSLSNANAVRRIDVNVQHSIGVNMTISGYRAAL